MRIVVCLFLLLILSMYSHAQINFKVGYNAQYSPLKTTNSLFEQYNKSKTTIVKPYSKIHYLHGLELGVKYMVSSKVGFEVSYHNLLSKNNKTSSLENNVTIRDEWRLSNRQIALGVENYYKSFGYGLSIVHSSWKYSKDIVGEDSKKEIFKTGGWAGKFHLLIMSKSDKNAFALKPYYILPLKENIDIGAVNSVLNGTNTPTVESFGSFGISVVFYNGPQ